MCVYVCVTCIYGYLCVYSCVFVHVCMCVHACVWNIILLYPCDMTGQVGLNKQKFNKHDNIMICDAISG